MTWRSDDPVPPIIAGAYPDATAEPAPQQERAPSNRRGVARAAERWVQDEHRKIQQREDELNAQAETLASWEASLNQRKKALEQDRVAVILLGVAALTALAMAVYTAATYGRAAL